MHVRDGRASLTTIVCPGRRCPTCSRSIDATTSLQEGLVPREGDVTVCCYCGCIMVFGAKQTVRPILQSELEALPQRTRRTIEHVRAVALDVFHRRRGDT